MIVRLSGPDALAFAAKLCPAPLARQGAVHASLAVRGMAVPAWIYLFASPRSYTGDDLVELHIPGNPLLAKMLLEELIALGARPAEPGEFTARAFFNGRMDLAEAEGVAATIAAGSEQELAAARRLMSGELARRLAPTVDSIANTLALLEIGIDFSEEDVTFLPEAEMASRIADADAELHRLLDESVRFERLSHEPAIVLVGRPNAGKSTLLNALAGHDRAVVSPVAGTTRDVLSAELFLPHGVCKVIDVAGLEDDSAHPAATADMPEQHAGAQRQGAADAEQAAIERQMRQRALRAVEEADCVVWVQDIADRRPPMALSRPADLIVISKIDVEAPLTGGGALLREGSLARPASVVETPFALGAHRADHAAQVRPLNGMQATPNQPDQRVQADLAMPEPQTGSDLEPPHGVKPMSQRGVTDPIYLSAKTGIGLPEFRAALDRLVFGHSSGAEALALNARHVKAVEEARAALGRAAGQFRAGAELVALELREALDALGSISGRISPDDLLGRIFAGFCIGK